MGDRKDNQGCISKNLTNDNIKFELKSSIKVISL
jgi:hypothetical protein